MTRADGSCGSDDAETISVDPSTVVKYCYSIDNPGTMPLYGITLVANNGTPADTSDDTTLFINALSGVSGTVREALVTIRITSYNVCYTKLLRGARNKSPKLPAVLTQSEVLA